MVWGNEMNGYEYWKMEMWIWWVGVVSEGGPCKLMMSASMNPSQWSLCLQPHSVYWHFHFSYQVYKANQHLHMQHHPQCNCYYSIHPHRTHRWCIYHSKTVDNHSSNPVEMNNRPFMRPSTIISSTWQI